MTQFQGKKMKFVNHLNFNESSLGTLWRRQFFSFFCQGSCDVWSISLYNDTRKFLTVEAFSRQGDQKAGKLNYF